jgi:hypothetical protein
LLHLHFVKQRRQAFAHLTMRFYKVALSEMTVCAVADVRIACAIDVSALRDNYFVQ